MISEQEEHSQRPDSPPYFASCVIETDARRTSASSEPRRLSSPTELVSERLECVNPTTDAVAQFKTDTATQSKTEQSIEECCKQCDYTASDFKTLKSHVWKRHHVRIHRCRACQPTTYDKTYEASHRSQSCQLKGRYLCELCDKEFQGFRSWHQHDLTHRSDRTIRCCYCHYKSERRLKVINHQAKHTDDGYKIRCGYCAWGCTSFPQMLCHAGSIHNGR